MSKGDRWRKTDYKNFFENFANIKFKKKNKKDGEVVPKVVRVKGKIIYKY